MPEIYLLPDPYGQYDSDNVQAVQDYADNANTYLEDVIGSDARIAVVKLERAITFPMTASEFAEYQEMNDGQKRVVYKEYVDSITGG